MYLNRKLLAQEPVINNIGTIMIRQLAKRQLLQDAKPFFALRRVSVLLYRNEAAAIKHNHVEYRPHYISRHLFHTGIQHVLNEHKIQKKSPTNTLVEDHAAAFEKTSIINEKFAEEEEKNYEHRKPLKIAIGRSASRRLKALMAEDQNKNLAILVSVESGGCHGFSYKLEMVDLFKDEYISKDLNGENSSLKEEDVVDPEEYSIFVRDGDCKVILPYSSLNILRESKIDYVKELIGTSFKVVDSPYTKSACGCGTSFDVDFDKLGKKI